MSDNKKYYYLKLKDNFFDSDEIVILESMPDGYKYSNILLKLYLRSLKNEGKLMFNSRIPFNSQMLATITRHSVGDVEKAVDVFKQLGLIEVLDNGAIYMLDIQNFIGKSSTEADRKRKFRAKIDSDRSLELPNGTNVRQTSDKSTPELELEIELEKELELEIENKGEGGEREPDELDFAFETSPRPKLDTELGSVFEHWQECININLNPTAQSTILDLWNKLINQTNKNDAAELFNWAIDQAVMANATNPRYVASVIEKSIVAKKIKNVTDAEKAAEEFRNKKQKAYSSKNQNVEKKTENKPVYIEQVVEPISELETNDLKAKMEMLKKSRISNEE